MQDGSGVRTVATSAAELLVVPLQRIGRCSVDDEPDIGLVDAHPERRRGRDDVDRPGRERLVRLVARGPRETGVIRERSEAALRQQSRELLRLRASGGVHETGSGLPV